MITDINKWLEGMVMAIMEENPETEFTWFSLLNVVNERTTEREWLDYGVYNHINLMARTLTRLSRRRFLTSRRYSHKQFYKYKPPKG
jgi:hypothetical protein